MTERQHTVEAVERALQAAWRDRVLELLTKIERNTRPEPEPIKVHSWPQRYPSITGHPPERPSRRG